MTMKLLRKVGLLVDALFWSLVTIYATADTATEAPKQRNAWCLAAPGYNDTSRDASRNETRLNCTNPCEGGFQFWSVEGEGEACHPCSSLGEGCVRCDGRRSDYARPYCTKCADGYNLTELISDNQCSSTSNPWWLYVACSAGGLLLLALLVVSVACCLARARRRRKTLHHTLPTLPSRSELGVSMSINEGPPPIGGGNPGGGASPPPQAIGKGSSPQRALPLPPSTHSPGVAGVSSSSQSNARREESGGKKPPYVGTNGIKRALINSPNPVTTKNAMPLGDPRRDRPPPSPKAPPQGGTAGWLGGGTSMSSPKPAPPIAPPVEKKSQESSQKAKYQNVNDDAAVMRMIDLKRKEREEESSRMTPMTRVKNSADSDAKLTRPDVIPPRAKASASTLPPADRRGPTTRAIRFDDPVPPPHPSALRHTLGPKYVNAPFSSSSNPRGGRLDPIVSSKGGWGNEEDPGDHGTRQIPQPPTASSLDDLSRIGGRVNTSLSRQAGYQADHPSVGSSSVVGIAPTERTGLGTTSQGAAGGGGAAGLGPPPPPHAAGGTLRGYVNVPHGGAKLPR